MKIHGSVVSLSFIFPHPLEDKKEKRKNMLLSSSLIDSFGEGESHEKVWKKGMSKKIKGGGQGVLTPLNWKPVFGGRITWNSYKKGCSGCEGVKVFMKQGNALLCLHLPMYVQQQQL